MNYTVHGILQDRILEWVAFLFSKGSSQPRDQTQVSNIAGRFFASWLTRPFTYQLASKYLLFSNYQANVDGVENSLWSFILPVKINQLSTLASTLGK